MRSPAVTPRNAPAAVLRTLGSDQSISMARDMTLRSIFSILAWDEVEGLEFVMRIDSRFIETRLAAPTDLVATGAPTFW
eukprot:CAMPEP_0167795684 /NCGR_PEP_ID=MMETSP0111_2-20121227/14589_1 /TAXON_ID=91324 /ORGANISM="Lotharella globosa, Strain CCCM811" /LENGTH=78 /DNA_ID=CAMNT_0007689413 /DNA_START=319 /DNA_END=555 /DNA_ORIENTATION=+